MRKQMLRQYRNMWIYAGFMLVILSLLTGMHCFLLRKIHISVQEIFASLRPKNCSQDSCSGKQRETDSRCCFC